MAAQVLGESCHTSVASSFRLIVRALVFTYHIDVSVDQSDVKQGHQVDHGEYVDSRDVARDRT